MFHFNSKAATTKYEDDCNDIGSSWQQELICGETQDPGSSESMVITFDHGNSTGSWQKKVGITIDHGGKNNG